MSIFAERRDRIQIIRFISDSITESDMAAIKVCIANALAEGIGDVVFAVTVGSLSNQLVISRLLLQCSEIIRRKQGRLRFVEEAQNGKSVFHNICGSLRIPYCDREEKMSVAMFANRAELNP
jgi:hypothetical protein